MLWIYLAAPNDKNGNPRRLYLLVDDEGNSRTAVDEGYEGVGAIRKRKDGTAGLPVTGRFETTPREYRALLKRFEGKTVEAAVAKTEPQEPQWEPETAPGYVCEMLGCERPGTRRLGGTDITPLAWSCEDHCEEVLGALKDLG